MLTGCTAVGKTEWALRWAERFGAEIVSCDSMLFYRGLDIGTAKPSPAERARVPHHLIDICEIAEPMDVAAFAERARTAVTDIESRGRTVLVCGGSGFYLRSFFSAVTDQVTVTPEIRLHVRGLTHGEALAELRALNPDGLGAIDIANPRRIERALERCLASGRTLAEMAADFARQAGPFADWTVEVTELRRSPDELNARIERRTAAMLEAGLVDEVIRARAAGLEKNPSAARAIGYREVLAMLDGRLEREALAGEIARNTRGLVKKQRTWFRAQLPPHRVIEASALVDEVGLFSVPATEP